VRTSPERFCVHCRMHVVDELNAGILKHLVKQGGFLLKLHQVELAKDPTSRATESSRSNLLAVRHTVKQVRIGGCDRCDRSRQTDPAFDDGEPLSRSGLCEKRVYSGGG
jgi:hypothetical protein